MEIKKIAIDRVTLADAAYAQIAGGVLSQDLRPGTRLLMDELAEALGISRTPVREALHRLEMERVIEPHGRRGYVVRELSDSELDKQYEGRAAIEPYVLAEVARRGGSAAAFLRHAFEELVELPQTTAMEVFQVNKAIHRATVEALDNEFLLRMFDVNWQTGIGIRVWADILEKGQAVNFADSHRSLVEAAESGDADLARRVVQEHIYAGRGLHPLHGPHSAL
ncbi:GntR family transcriptional regulator [Arthrobacter livingstonensis]|uniref:GntR family transcriptional regulator n=1 Tax=Arthrobacter livingstonensis TaxID=670078 RepID=UPI00147527DC|nr:GntR family transcriptional regulator [Arthrobacter livingstonensis]